MASIIVYGADWCPTTRATLAHLKRLRVPFDYIDIDNDPEAAAWVASQNDGKEKKPTLKIDGQVLRTPTEDELDTVLEENGLLS